MYVTGRFSQTVDFDPGVGTFNLSGPGYFDNFVQKLDSNGDFLWAKVMGGSSYPWRAADITLDDSGILYIVGQFEGTADFDPGPGTTNLTSVGLRDIFLQKLDTSGSFVWAKAIRRDRR
jgi:hypothetical protein